MLFNIRDLVKSAGLAAGAALLYIATFGSPVYAQEPKAQPAQQKATAEENGLVRKAEELNSKIQSAKTDQEHLELSKQALRCYKEAEEKRPGDQYKGSIAVFETKVFNLEKKLKNAASGTQTPQPEKKPATQPAKQPEPAKAPNAQPAAKPAQPAAAPPVTDFAKKESERFEHVIDIGGRTGINYTTKSYSLMPRIKISDFIEGDGIYELLNFQTPSGIDVVRRTFAGAASASLPGIIKIKAVGDNTEEIQKQFTSTLVSDPSFDVRADVYAKNTDAHQFMAAMLELGPVFIPLSIEISAHDHLQRIITEITQATYVKNKTIPNGDYSEQITSSQQSKIRSSGGQGIIKHYINCKGDVPFDGFIGLLFDYENMLLQMAGSEEERIISMHFGTTGKVNIADHIGLTFLAAQQYIDAPSTGRDQWNSTPLFAAICAATPMINLGTKDKKFNAGATVLGTISYLNNRHVGGSLGGVISFGPSKAPINFFNDYHEARGKSMLGLRTELSNRLVQLADETDLRMLPFAMYPSMDWAVVLFGQGGAADTYGLNGKDVQANFANIGVLLRTPKISIGATVYYLDDKTRIKQGGDLTLQLPDLGNILLYIGGFKESDPKMKDSNIGAELGFIIK